MTTVVLSILIAVLAGALVWALLRGRGSAAPERVRVDVIAERVRSVGKLVGLEVCAKEIATATKGWNWLPPLLLSQARLAMIFHFEKQYWVDLASIGRGDVTDLGDGRFRLRVPPIRGELRLIDVTPYDIQDGRVLGLFDVIQMGATTQKGLMDKAQTQAAELYHANDERYLVEARASVERHLASLLQLFDCSVEIAWGGDEGAEHAAPTKPVKVARTVLLA